MSEWLERIVSNHLSSVEQESLLARAEQAEAAIARVRELWTTCSCDRCTTNHLAILRALAVDVDNMDGAE